MSINPKFTNTVVSRKGPVCDFGDGCKILCTVFHDRASAAQQAIKSSPHLAEALFSFGLNEKTEAVDMALAIQEARYWPDLNCKCSLSR